MSTPTLQPARGNVLGRNVGRILDVPRASVFRVAALSIANNTTTAVIWDTIDLDDPQSEALWSAANPTRLTAITAGTYSVKAWGVWQSSGGGIRQLYIRKNGVGQYANTVFDSGTVAGTASQSTTADIRLDAGDYVEVMVLQTCGAPLAFTPVSGTLNIDRFNGFQACLIST